MDFLFTSIVLILMPVGFLIIGAPFMYRFRSEGPTRRRPSGIDHTDLDAHAHFPESDT